MFAPWKESCDIPTQRIKKQRHHFANAGPSSENYGFSSSHEWSQESTIKKAACWRTDAFELWCWRRLLRVPWTARRPNQSILKEINLDYSSEELMLNLQYFDHLVWRTESLEKSLMLGKIEGRRRRDDRGRDGWMASVSQWTWVWASSGSWWKTEEPGVLLSAGSQRVRHR